jgi:hypothetical protein
MKASNDFQRNPEADQRVETPCRSHDQRQYCPLLNDVDAGSVRNAELTFVGISEGDIAPKCAATGLR